MLEFVHFTFCTTFAFTIFIFASKNNLSYKVEGTCCKTLHRSILLVLRSVMLVAQNIKVKTFMS